jgi:RimJ/RimL family protein N-acetyltransferase
MDFTIQTQHLLLRPFTPEDAPALHRISNEPYVLQWMPDWEMTEEDTRGLIRFFISQQEKASKTTARVMFAMVAADRVIGMTGIGNKEEVDNEIEIAYLISEEFAGRGYTSEAVAAVSQWALKNLGLDYLIAIVETDNIPSQRVVEKSGFRKIDCRMILDSGQQEAKPFYYYRLYPAGQ